MMATRSQTSGRGSTEGQDRRNQIQAGDSAAEAFHQTQETMVRSAAELNQEIMQFASTLMRQNQALLQLVTRSIGEVWAHLLSANQEYVEQLRRLADVTQRTTQDSWGLMQAAAREQGETVSSAIQSTALTAERAINWSQANWQDLGATVKEQWDKLTDADLAGVESRDQLVNRIEQRYGIARAEAERQVRAFESRSGAGESGRGQQPQAQQAGGGGRSTKAAVRRPAAKRSRRAG
jgi:uncharacterized protein YjbJ (UPF0337 family)